jgi:hypothetical protein
MSKRNKASKRREMNRNRDREEGTIIRLVPVDEMKNSEYEIRLSRKIRNESEGSNEAETLTQVLIYCDENFPDHLKELKEWVDSVGDFRFKIPIGDMTHTWDYSNIRDCFEEMGKAVEVLSDSDFLKLYGAPRQDIKEALEKRKQACLKALSSVA